MPKEIKPVIAIDVGTSQVRVVAARPEPDGQLEVIAFGRAVSTGVERGLVANIDETSAAIRKAFNAAGIDNRFRGGRLIAGISGKHLTSYNAIGQVVAARPDDTISERDAARALLAAKPLDLADGLTLLHQAVRGYRIDGLRAQQEVVGMRGAKLEVDCHLIAANETAIVNLRKAVQMAGGEIDQVLFAGLASAHTSLTLAEKEAGALFLNIGAGTTDIVAYAQGGIFHSSCLPLGGNQIANDIAIALNTSFAVAEATLQTYGRGTNDGIKADEELTIQCFGARGERLAKRRYLNEIIRLRLTETLQLAYARVRHAAPGLSLPAGLILSGGVANLPSIELLAEGILKMPARVGIYTQDGEGPALLEGPGFTTAIGLLEVAADSAFAVAEERKDRSPLKLLPQLIGMGMRA